MRTLASPAEPLALPLTGPMDRPSWALLVMFVVALSLAGYFAVRYHYRGHVVAVDLFEVVLAPAIFTLEWRYVVVVAVAGMAVSQALRRVRPSRALFNVAQEGIGAGLGAAVLGALAGPGARTQGDLPALALAMAVVLLTSVVALAIVLAVRHRGSRRSWLATAVPALLRDAAVPTGVSLVWGLLFVVTYAWAPAVVPLFAVPLVLLHWANRSYARSRVEQVRLRALHRATQALLEHTDARDAITDFLAATGSGLRWEVVELVLTDASGRTVHRHQDGPPQPYEHYWQPAPRRTVASLLLETVAPDLQAVRVDTSSATGELAALMRHEQWSDAAAAPVVTPDGEILGLLSVYDRGGAAAFPERELPVLKALAGELAAALQRSILQAGFAEERAKLSHIVDGTVDGIATLSPDGTVLSWNRAFERITGRDATAVIGSPVDDVLCPTDERGQPVDLTAWPCVGPDRLPAALAVAAADGRRRTLACSYSAGPRRKPTDELVLVARDVTDEHRNRRLLETERVVFARMAAGDDLAEVLDALVSSVAPDGSGICCGVLLYDESTGELRRAAGAGDVRASRGRSDEVIEVPVRGDRGERPLGSLRVARQRADTPLPDRELLERAAALVSVAVGRSRSERLLTYRATHDLVTGLPNRVVFLDRCEQALARARRGNQQVVVTFLDLDRFKVVNDSLGHEAGDRLLQAVGRRLASVLRPQDTVARFGGDEFTVLCEGVLDEDQLLGPVQRIRKALADPFSLGEHEVFVTASMGIAVSSGEVGADAVVGQADAAMYRAKERGGHRWELFDDAMRDRAQARMALQNAMHRGLERGEFEVHYQPLVSLSDHRVTGAEALLRWRHPERGLLAPAEYIALAESNGLIVPIGEHVLRTACAQAKDWQDDPTPGQPQAMSINLSARQFLQPDLTDMVARALKDTGVDPGSISFEITESSAMDDAGATVATMEDLKALGVGLVIDDFGTGYSSLTYLKRFPVDGLKVDRSFVVGLGTDDEDSAIVTAVIDLAHSLGIVAVAEGVETAQQLERLRDLGCDAAQGYHLGRPQPAAAF